MKPTPLPPNPKLIDRLEYALQWAFCWVIVDIKGDPMISGLCTGALMIVPIYGIGYLISFLTGPLEAVSDEVQLELLAPWYTQNTSESRTLELLDAIPKYPFAVTTKIPKPERLEVPFTLRGQRYTAFIAPAQI